jgi:thiamine pyrophosphate-dependent acetolactate synthase large subunit-like protein
MLTGARALVDCLLREGIDHVFGIPGTQNLPIIDVLRDTPEIRFILTRHEQGAAFMACGFARASGGPAVVTATEGPGITNLATGIAAAYKGYVPVVAVNGTQENWIRERDALQEMDQVSFFRPITRWAYSIPSASKLQEAMRKAFRVALAEPLGPVHVEASRDILLQQTESEPIEPAAYRVASLPDCSPASLDRAWALLSEAARPVLLAGTGVAREGARAVLVDLAERSGIPVASLHSVPDVFPTSHPLALGPVGRNGWSSANRTVPRADLIVAVGARLDLSSTLHRYEVISPEAKLIHHAATPDAIGVVFPVTLGLTGSATSFLQGLLERATRAGRRWAWVDVAEARARWDEERRRVVDSDAVPIQPPFVARTLRETLPSNGLVVIDAGNAGKHVRTSSATDEPVSFMYTDDWGAVGSGLPIAMGAKLARPDRPVACLVGDMGMMCNLGELETAVRERIPVVCVVCNDQGLGNERAWQKELYGGRFYAVDYQNPDFAALARVFGAYGEQVRQPADLPAALRRALESGKPAVLDVLIDQETLASVAFRAS